MVARGLSTGSLIMLSGVQLLIFAVVYAVHGGNLHVRCEALMSKFVLGNE
jgi:hypothetical protein